MAFMGLRTAVLEFGKGIFGKTLQHEVVVDSSDDESTSDDECAPASCLHKDFLESSPDWGSASSDGDDYDG